MTMRQAIATVFACALTLALAACGEQEPHPARELILEEINAPVDPLDTSRRMELTDREVSERFIELFYNQNRLVEGFEAWVHPDYVQHDPNSPTGRDATIEVLAAHMQRNPGMTHDIKRTIYGEDDQGRTLVAVHYHFKRAPDDRGSAVVDIYRVENGYLVEHWDVIQPVPETALNDNTMF